MRILVLGASYGSLLATKCALVGHSVDLVCLPAEADAINRNGIVVRFPTVRSKPVLEVHSTCLPGRIAAGGTRAFTPSRYDLVGLAMQEPQYRLPDVRELLEAIAVARVPCLSVMNMPPPPYLRRLGSVDVAAVHHCYTDHTVWDAFDPAYMTLCSPDAQSIRPDAAMPHLVEVRLATNFKAAPFQSQVHTDLLLRLEREIDAARLPTPDGPVEVPVKLRVSNSLFVPLSKWCMLLSGNYRCVDADGIRCIRDAVHDDLEATRGVYEWVAAVCRKLGANEADLVPFVKYADAALSLTSPSSAARALASGACHIERADLLVQALARRLAMQCKQVDTIVALVDQRLASNRARAERR